MLRKILLACGVLSSLLYVATDVLGALRYEGYSYASQAVSELMAVGAPSKPLVDRLFIVYDVLVVAFGVGVCTVARRKSALQVIGRLLIAIGAIGLVTTLFFPMNQRGVEQVGSDTPHIVFTIVLMMCILSAIAFGASLPWRWFRVYSIVTLLVVIAFGAMAASDGIRLAAQEPTPWLGITERINIGAYLLWVLVLAISLLRIHERWTRSSAIKTSVALFVLSLIAFAVPCAEAIEQHSETAVAEAPDVSVREQDGVYHVAATFSVAQTVPVIFDVLTGYEQIPRYMPDVRSSRVIERNEGHAVVEQEAVARVMMFTKRVHLLLDVREEPLVIRFRDRCGKSFDYYEGVWTLAPKGRERVEVRYELAAKPSFDVPGFLLKRLLKRDAQEMIRRLQNEMARPR